MSKKFETRVYHEDTDFIGIVYYANYFKFIERARSEAIREVGIDQYNLKLEHGIFFVVSKLKAKFVQAAKFNDLLFTETDLLYIKSASLGLEQRIFRNENLIFTAEIKLACINQTGRPVKLPSEVKRNLLSI
ncbi:MAG: YbgC/FadM family acyl-CoA thioesterase [Paracoccaceae bacterium]|nr:MAG: thioesterase [Paracoccaceae bacterium]